MVETVPASPTRDQDITNETPYPQASPIEQATGDIEKLICSRPTTPYPRAISIEQATGDIEQLICPRPTTPYPRASPIDQATEDLEQPIGPELQISYNYTQRYTRVNSPVSRTTACPRSPDGPEQPEYPCRSMTPGEE